MAYMASSRALTSRYIYDVVGTTNGSAALFLNYNGVVGKVGTAADVFNCITSVMVSCAVDKTAGYKPCPCKPSINCISVPLILLEMAV